MQHQVVFASYAAIEEANLTWRKNQKAPPFHYARRAQFYREDDFVTVFAIPPENTTLKGVVLLFHDCYEEGADWFRGSEHMAVSTAFLASGYAAIAFTAQMEYTPYCWDTMLRTSFDENDTHLLPRNSEVKLIQKALAMTLLKIKHKSYSGQWKSINEIPLVGVGYGSGADFLSVLARFVKLQGIALYMSGGASTISWQYTSQLSMIPEWTNTILKFPPTVFVYMTMDKRLNYEAVIKESVTILTEDGVSTHTLKIPPAYVTTLELVRRIPKMTKICATEVREQLLNVNYLSERGLLRSRPGTFYEFLNEIATRPLCKEVTHAKYLLETLDACFGKSFMTGERVDEVIEFFEMHL